MTLLSVLKETEAHETRCAVSPDTVKRFRALGLQVRVEAGAGEASGIADAAFEQAGAVICESLHACLDGTHILLCVGPPPVKAIDQLNPGCMVIGMLSPYSQAQWIRHCALKGITAFAMELMPRISRAQSMDVLSSQANLAGYRAVIEAVAASAKATPMLMTAAGTIPPAKVLILGAGVAGLQAIATAKRLGAVVSAFDVRPAVKEQVQSLGARFIEVAAIDTEAETKSGYAREMSAEYQIRQMALIHETLRNADIAIATALIPGRPAPVLITQAMLADMKPGAVIVDLAVASGGNCPLSRLNEIIQIGGVTIVGYANMAGRVAADATPLYARNLYHFLATFFGKDNELEVNFDDELIKATLLTRKGAIVQPQFAGGPP